jgi:hypothetical protein
LSHPAGRQPDRQPAAHVSPSARVGAARNVVKPSARRAPCRGVGQLVPLSAPWSGLEVRSLAGLPLIETRGL